MDFAGIGVDIVLLSRVKDAVETAGEAFLNSVFTKLEQERAASDASYIACLATTFAGKEAIFKCFNIGWGSGVQLKEVEIREGPFGEPYAVLSGQFAILAKERKVRKVILSLSFDGDYAIAVAALVD